MLVPLTVRDLMSTGVETVGPAATVRAVAERLYGSDIGSVVVTRDDRVVGIITERNLVGVLARAEDPDATVVERVMTPDPVTVAPDASIEAAALLLESGGFRRLPVVEDGGESNGSRDDGEGLLVGLLTARDLSYYLPHRLDDSPQSSQRPTPSSGTVYDETGWSFEHEGDEPVEVGDVVRFRKTVSDADVLAFAHATGDTNRLHLDDAFAEQTRFGGRIVHGTLTLGVISAALARLPGLTIYLGQDIRYLGPVAPDTTVTAVCEVTEALGESRYRLSTAVYDEADDAVVDGEATVLIDDIPADSVEK